MEDWFLRRLRKCLKTDFGMSEWKNEWVNVFIIIIIIIIVITTTTTTTTTTASDLSLGGSSPYTSTDKTNKNKYT
jgi:hypothetical protein